LTRIEDAVFTDREPQSKKTIEVGCKVKLLEHYQLQNGDVVVVEFAE